MPSRFRLTLVAALAALSLPALAPASAFAAPVHHPAAKRPAIRRTAPPKPAAKPAVQTGTVEVHLLALNDFHGHIEADRTVTVNGTKEPVGGAAFIATILRREKAKRPNTLLVDAGDMVGASPPVSALFEDEPTVEFLNMTGMDVGTLGNHEFDEGVSELKRLWHGGVNPASRYYPKPFAGAKFPIVCANIVDAATGKTLFPPYIVKTVGGAKVAFIGAITAELPDVTTAAALDGVKELDPVAAINQSVAALKKQGVHAIVVLIHEGGKQTPENPQGQLVGAIVDVARRLDPDVDVLVSAHSHQYTDTMLGHTLITQARWSGDAYADIDLTVDRKSDDIVRKSARIVDTVHEGVAPAPDVDAMVKEYEALAAPRINKAIGEVAPEVAGSRREKDAPLGNLIADAQREAAKADIAFTNPGGVRAELTAGPVTWGQLYAVQPFNNQVMVLKMTGAQIKAVLEQQWGPGEGGEPRETILFPSGITYTYDPAGEYGHRVMGVVGPDGQPLEDTRTYTVAVNSFLAGGGDGFPGFKDITAREPGPNDLDALVDYITAHPRIVPESHRISIVQK